MYDGNGNSYNTTLTDPRNILTITPRIKDNKTKELINYHNTYNLTLGAHFSQSIRTPKE